MNVLGINASGLHDSSACLVVDGEIKAFSAEERFTGVKHDKAFPTNAIEFCLAYAGMAPTDVNIVAHGWDFLTTQNEALLFHMSRALEMAKSSDREAIEYLRKKYGAHKDIFDTFKSTEDRCRRLTNGPFVPVQHHVAHAFSAFPLSGFGTQAILVVDGSGETMTSSLWHFDGKALKFLKAYHLPHSIGTFYAAVTQFLGFMHHDEEWKVMGWAPYGVPRFEHVLQRMFSPSTHEADRSYYASHGTPWYSPKLAQDLGVAPRDRDGAFDQVYADIAASAQKVLEDAVTALAREIRALTGERCLTMAGGVALNGKANALILEQGIFEQLFVQPAAADDGVAIGAALKAACDHQDHIMRPLSHVYYGPAFDEIEIRAALQRRRLPFKRLGERQLIEQVAGALAEGKVVGWFQDRAELGPRALGNRSILADPRRSEMKDILNRKIKFREGFRPFAPSVLEEEAADYFVGSVNDCEFMNRILPVAHGKRTVIPAVTHIDGTARIQVVKKSVNRRYYDLIKSFAEKTQVPIVINTSFNVKGKPICNSPDDAITCFLETGLDLLAIGDFVVDKANVHAR